MLLVTVETRSEIAEAMSHRNYTAKRQPCLIGTLEHPTPWDRAHEDLNALLDALEAAPDANA